MTGTTEPIDTKEQIARIQHMLDESDKFRAEQRKLIAESEKLSAEERKLHAEELKLVRDRRLAPIILVSTLTGVVTGAIVAIINILTRS